MLRRIGYILGLLFVAACAAAYPLTWRRFAGFTIRAPWMIEVVALGGQVQVYWTEHGDEWSVSRPYVSDYEDERPNGAHWRVSTSRNPGSFGTLRFPVWVPTVAVVLFMAWRWRRCRRCQSTGFPLDQRTSNLPNHSTY